MKSSWSCFSSVAMQNWHHRCPVVSGQRPTSANGLFFHLCLIDDAITNLGSEHELLFHLPAITRAIAYDLAASRLELGLGGGELSVGRTAILLSSLPPSFMQPPNISLTFVIFTAEERTVIYWAVRVCSAGSDEVRPDKATYDHFPTYAGAFHLWDFTALTVLCLTLC